MCATTRPRGSTTALSPEIAAWTIHRPVSTARTWLMITCSRDAAVSPHVESLVVTIMRLAPVAANCRNRFGKMFSKQIGVPTFAPSIWNNLISWPGAMSRGTTLNCSTHPKSLRKGTYSPNGTGWVLV